MGMGMGIKDEADANSNNKNNIDGYYPLKKLFILAYFNLAQ